MQDYDSKLLQLQVNYTDDTEGKTTYLFSNTTDNVYTCTRYERDTIIVDNGFSVMPRKWEILLGGFLIVLLIPAVMGVANVPDILKDRTSIAWSTENGVML